MGIGGSIGFLPFLDHYIGIFFQIPVKCKSTLWTIQEIY